MASPVDAARVNNGIVGNSATTDHGFTVPGSLGSVVAGDLLIAFVRWTGPPGTITTPAPAWTQLASDVSDASDDQTAVYYRYCDGTENGVKLRIDSSISIKSVGVFWKITGAANPATQAPEISTVAIGTTTANTANPASRAVTGGPKDVLYLALAGIAGSGATPTAAPANYTNLVTHIVGGGSAATQGAIGGASRQISASSSDDPGVFTHPAAATGWTAWTVVIHPAGPANQNITVSGRGSAQAFGSLSVTTPPPPPQTVPVTGITRGVAKTATVVDQFVVDDGHVVDGAAVAGETLFGTPVLTIKPPATIVPVSGVGPSGVTAPYSTTVMADSPRAYWRLGANPLQDASTNGNTLTTPQNAPSPVTGLVPSDTADGSRLFPGSSTPSYYYATDSSSLSITGTTFSIEAWIKCTGVDQLRTLLRKESLQYGLFIYNGNLGYWYNDGANRQVDGSGAPIAVNTLYHVVVTDDGTTVRFYLNGFLYQSVGRPSAGAIVDTSGLVAIGVSNNGGSVTGFWGGTLDEVALYATALPVDRVFAHYSAGALVTQFGTPTTKTTVSKPAGGVASAQSFGTPVIKTAISKPSAGVGSAQAFGAPTVTVKGPLQIVPVPGVFPPGYTNLASIVGAVISGDGHVVGGGPSVAAQFGVPVVSVVPAGIILPSGVGTAAAFGVPVIAKGAVSRTLVGLGSAQAFGTVSTVKGVATRTVVGLGSAQAFGTITTVVTGGGLQTRIVNGVASAQQFGTLTISKRVTVTVNGLGSAQQFGLLTPGAGSPQTVQVPGLQQQTGVYSITGGVIAGDGHLVGGSGLLFGWVTIVPGRVFTTVPGVGSAQQFGQVTITWPQTIPVTGVSSSQRFGRPFVANLLQVVTCTSLVTVAVSCVTFTSGSSGCDDLTVTAPADQPLVGAPASDDTLTLVPA